MQIENAVSLFGGRRDIWGSIRNIKASKIAIKDPLSRLERDWLIGRVASVRGVERVVYDGGDAHRLVVEYDADVVDLGELFDFLSVCGVHPDLAPIQLS